MDEYTACLDPYQPNRAGMAFLVSNQMFPIEDKVHFSGIMTVIITNNPKMNHEY
jgi:hypothetical protein